MASIIIDGIISSASTLLIMLAFSPLKNSPALHQSYDQNDHGNDQKNVDQAATDVEREKSQSPQNYQDDYDCFKHADLLFFFYFSLPCSQPLLDGTMGSGEATCLNAVFMPGSLRILRISGN
jgi:aryl-phospho-beta-D-glucosidase BglC (GH1 family)